MNIKVPLINPYRPEGSTKKGKTKKKGASMKRKRKAAKRPNAAKKRRSVRAKRTYRKNPVRKRKPATRRKRRVVSRTYKRTRSKRVRYNPGNIKLLPNQQQIISMLSGGAGIIGGAIAMPFVYRIVPKGLKDKREFLGGIHVILGVALMSMLKSKNAKTFSASLAATGIYDLIAMNIPQIGLPGLPTSIPLVEDLLPEKPDVPGEPVSASYPSLPSGYSASYPVPAAPVSRVAAGSMGASYNAPGMRTEGYMLGTDNPYEGIEGYD